jgi:hypothetical protein
VPAFGNHVLDKGFDAAAALTKFRAVKYSAVDSLENPSVTPVTADTDIVLGIAQFDVSAGEITKGKGATLRTMGITEWECSAAVAVGQLVTIAADGRCLPATTGKRVHGVCVGSPTSAAGSRAAIELSLNSHLVA